MPIEPFQLVEDYGEAVLLGNAALFIGAGISQGAGLPGWGALLDPIRVGCNVPEHHDLPLVAEYIVNEATDGRQAIEDHILAELSKTSMRPARSHRLISLLALREVWTTNYDPLIEKAMAAADIDVAVAFDENTTRAIASNHARTVIKMHGSINTELKWVAPPIITRTDYEQYESQHPRMWNVLRASYLSRSMLFMGFSFTDPNVDILLRLARTLGTAGGDRHYAVMKCPGPGDPDDEKRLHALRTADLEQSGVAVCEIDDYDQNTELLTQLLRRTRPARIFISGSTGLKGKTTSEEDERLLGDWTLAIARQLAPRTDWEIASLGGPAGWLTSRDVARALSSC